MILKRVYNLGKKFHEYLQVTDRVHATHGHAEITKDGSQEKHHKYKLNKENERRGGLSRSQSTLPRSRHHEGLSARFFTYNL